MYIYFCIHTAAAAAAAAADDDDLFGGCRDLTPNMVFFDKFTRSLAFPLADVLDAHGLQANGESVAGVEDGEGLRGGVGRSVCVGARCVRVRVVVAGFAVVVRVDVAEGEGSFAGQGEFEDWGVELGGKVEEGGH